MLIKLNDGESVTVQMNHDTSEKPYSITIMRRSNCLMTREFNHENNNFERKLCSICVKMKDLPKHYLGKHGDECYMCCSTIYEEKQQ